MSTQATPSPIATSCAPVHVRDVQLSGHISKSVAMEYIVAAATDNAGFEDRSICGWDVEFVDVQAGQKEHHTERLARVVSCNQERTVVAVAFVSHAPSPGNFAAWEGEVTDLIAEALDASYSDAQGVVEAQPLCMQLAWSMGMSVQEAAAKILADATSAA